MKLQIAPRETPLHRRTRLEVLLHEMPDPPFGSRGIYGITEAGLPTRFRFLHPDARSSLLAAEKDFPDVFHFSDMFRNANGSRKRRQKNRQRRIAQNKRPIYTGKLPGSSGHNFGLCVDHDIEGNLRRLAAFTEEMISKAEYDHLWREYGWWCHRDGPDGDHKRGREDWHFNYFGDDPDRWLDHSDESTAGGIEAKLQYMYGPFRLDEHRISALLKVAGYDDDAQSISAFQQEWTLNPDGIAGPATQRVLAYVTADFIDGNGELITEQVVA